MKTVKYIFESARPTTWLRIAGELLLGFAVAGQINSEALFRFGMVFLAVGPLLWSAAYILNDLTDITLDKQHPLRGQRPIARGQLSTKSAVFAIIILTFSAYTAGMVLGPLFIAGVVILTMSQLAYTLPGLRFKEKAYVDILSNAVNAAIRFILGFAAGAMTVQGLPIFFFFYTVLLKVLFFMGHRIQSREVEVKNDFKSTVSIMTPFQLKILLVVIAVIDSGLYLAAIVYDNLGWEMMLPAFVFGLLLVPFIRKVRSGYLEHKEQSLGTRVYLYVCFLLFALVILAVRVS